MPGGEGLELVPDLAHEDVHRAVPVREPAAPDLLEELVARDDPPLLQRERVEEAELGRRQLDALATDVGLDVERVDRQLLDLDWLAATLVLHADAATSRRAYARDKLFHGERLHEVVVGADLEGVHAVVLGPTGAHDDDRRPDPLGARRLDQLPAVDAREHEVEDAYIRPLVAKAREARLPLVHPQRIEAGRGEVPGHALCDDVVVLDDEHLRHAASILPSGRAHGGTGKVAKW